VTGPEFNQSNPEDLYKIRLGNAARHLIQASQMPTSDVLLRTAPEIAALADLRFDPDEVDSNSPHYKAGASDALRIAAEQLTGYLLHPSEVDRLKRDGVATTFAAVAADPGIGEDRLNGFHDEAKALDHLRVLRGLLLVEPAMVKPGSFFGWQLTPQGNSIFLKLLPKHLAPFLTDHEIAAAVVSIIKSY
jgi:hypothetical protein